MVRRLPPLNALRSFEAAARYESFTQAADELCVTPGAVSKQIRTLEEYVKAPLFERKASQSILTQAGMLYLAAVREMFDSMESTTETIFPNHGLNDTLHINILPSLSSRWFIPLLEDFKQHYPMIQVVVTTGDGTIDFDKTGADIAIRVAREPAWKQLFVEKLMDEELIAVYSPDFAAQFPGLTHHNLLQHSTRPEMWSEYFASIGYAEGNIKHTLSFEHFYMLIEAAKDGLGVALIPDFQIRKELAEGSLVIAREPSFKSPYSYYMLAPKQTKEQRKVRAFCKWIKGKTSC